MVSFLTKLFGKEKKRGEISPVEAVRTALEGVIERSGLDLKFTLSQNSEGFVVSIEGTDGNLLTDRDGMALDAFQTFVKRLLQNRFPNEKLEVVVDCNGYLESAANELKELADKLKGVVLERGTPAYVRALMPRDRKTVHRHLAQDPRVKSQSIGDGFLKKIKIYSVDKRNHQPSPEA